MSKTEAAIAVAEYAVADPNCMVCGYHHDHGHVPSCPVLAYYLVARDEEEKSPPLARIEAKLTPEAVGPAPVAVRDEAWWLSLVRRIEEAENVGFDNVPAVIRVLQDTFGQDGVSPAPDFAAMAEDFHEHGTYLEPFQRKCLATWLSANAHRFATPAPALVGGYWTSDHAPAFDVEALVAGVQPYWAKHGCTVYDAIRAVAREMLKGGVK